MSNVGKLDRWIRLILGLALIAVLFVPVFSGSSGGILGGNDGWLLVLPAIGLVLILTALFRFCPAYRLFGLSSCPLKRTTTRT